MSDAVSPASSPKIRLVLLWHMHQPFYKDMVTGEYRLPWVRLHALKDYYGMVKLLDEFPEVHQNFNLVPSLVAQIQDYVSGDAHDPFFDLVAKPANELTAADRRFALQYLFQANPVNMIGRYPRYRELWEKYRSTSDRPEGPESYFVARDYADLQVLSQLAWFDEFFLADSDIAALVQKGEDFTRDDQQLVTAREREILAKVLPAYADAVQRGGIELSATPFYHPILPLLCDTNAGAESSPGLALPTRRFRHPDDASLQIQRALDSHQALFGVRPKGLWPSEGSVSEEALKLACREGIEWMATDEGVLGRSLDFNFARHNGDHLTVDGAERLYNIYRYEKDETRMHLVFRDHRLSDLIGFVYSGMPAQDAANHLIRNIKDSAQPLLDQGKNAVVSIILDGENAWEYYPQSGREFLRRFYDALQRDEQIEPVTISEAIARHAEADFRPVASPGSGLVDRRQLQRLDRRSGRQSRLGLAGRSARLLRPSRQSCLRSAATDRLGRVADRRGQRLELVVRSGTSLGQRPRLRRALPQASLQRLSRAGRHSAGGAEHADHQRRSAAKLHSADRVCARARRRPGQRILRVDGRGELHLRSAHQRDAWQAVSARRGLRWTRRRFRFRPSRLSSRHSRRRVSAW